MGIDAMRPVPLENLVAGSFEPVYRVPLDISAGEIPTLPLSLYGSVALARPRDFPDSLVSGNSAFIYLFDARQKGLAGLSFDEGRFGTLGYVTEGIEVLEQIRDGDDIVHVEVLSGMDRFRPGTGDGPAGKKP